MQGGTRLAASVLAVLLCACSAPARPPGEQPFTPADCEGLPALTLEALPSTLRSKEAAHLVAAGGRAPYRFELEPGGSGGALNGERFVGGGTPSPDRLWVQDACGGRVSAAVTVVASFDVQPTRATVKPGVRFKVAVAGTMGAPAFALTRSGSGGTVTQEGVYTAGAKTGLDVLSVRDPRSGDEALLQYDVTPTARFRATPAKLALPAGSSVPLLAADGSGHVRWKVVGGNGTVDGDRLTVPAMAAGTLALEATDAFTGERATAAVRVLDELTRPTRAHGRLTDFGSAVAADFDGDGLEDVALGIPESDLQRPQGGAVLVFKASAEGLPPSPTWVLAGTSDTAQFGASLATGDLDGDGKVELVVAAPGADVVNGDSGALFLYRFTEAGPVPLREPLAGLTRAGGFGSSLAVTDLDGDGDADLVVGSPGADLAPTAVLVRRGTVDVYLLDRGQPIPEAPTLRLGGADLAADGKLQPAADLRLGRALVSADLNGDGRADLAALGTVSNSLLGGVASARVQPAVEVYFGRAGPSPFESSPDLFLLPSDAADVSEGVFRLGVAPAAAGKPALLVVLVDGADAPDLSAQGGAKAALSAGGALLYELSARRPTGRAAERPLQLGRLDAFARIYGDAAGISAGRSFAVADVDGKPGRELLLGAPYASAGAVSAGGKLLAYPLDGLTAGAVLNKPLDVRAGQERWECLGAALVAWTQPSGVGLVTLGLRVSTSAGAFTGRVDALSRAGNGPLAQWTRRSAVVPARASVDQFGVGVAAARQAGGKTAVLVGAPGYAGPGALNDGNDRGAGQVFASQADAPKAATLVAEGAASPLLKGGRGVGTDVAFSDFDGDGRPDALIGSPNLVAPGAAVRATEIAPHYERENPGCIAAANSAVGGVQVLLGQADGSFKPAYRLWAPADIAGCTPVGDARCRRSGIGRGLAGGFDFNGDGKQDVAALRTNGLELYLGRAPDSATLARLTMVCDPVLTVPYSTRPTSVPTALGDLDGDGCDEVGYRYADAARAGVVLLFGFDPDGVRCGGRKVAASVRLAGDLDVGLNSIGLGVAMARAGDFLGDGKPRLAVSASGFPVEGRAQPAVLLYDMAALAARRPASGEALVGALGDGLVPAVLAHPKRAVGFGAALAGNVDLTGDGKPELLVGVTGDDFAADGAGAVLAYAGGSLAGSQAEPWLIIAGDGAERGAFGQSLGLARGAAGPPVLVIGAPTSYRTGTQNGTAFVLPLGF